MQTSKGVDLVVDYDGRSATIDFRYNGRKVAGETFDRHDDSWWWAGERIENLPNSEKLKELLDKTL